MGSACGSWGGRKIRCGRKQCKLQLCLAGVNCSKYSAQKRLGSADPLHELPSLPRTGRPPPCLPMGMGQSWPKSCYPKCLVTGSLAAAALGKVGSRIWKAPRLLTRLLASPPAPSPATRTSSVCAYTPSRSPCLLCLPRQCSPPLLISRCQQSHCYHGSEPPQLLASPSQTQRPAPSEKPVRLSAFRSAGLSPQHFCSLTTLLASPGEVAHKVEAVAAQTTSS